MYELESLGHGNGVPGVISVVSLFHLRARPVWEESREEARLLSCLATTQHHREETATAEIPAWQNCAAG
ncbi:hypothetical protein EYF80_022359 [Liparis tanakae]|uniref:Uncharacterized protein n=1 Tax=Liparis tanakae TaxID=230148 RepID=A0A4Z2HQZ9_9TELE|nr:hypothetical protein EYF80_022359 [Liparis tanakae]